MTCTQDSTRTVNAVTPAISESQLGAIRLLVMATGPLVRTGIQLLAGGQAGAICEYSLATEYYADFWPRRTKGACEIDISTSQNDFNKK
jgi:hypothetical protein